MNKQTRKKLSEIIETLQEQQSAISEIADEEQDKADNMPENMQMSDRHDDFEEIASMLTDASDSLEDVIDQIQEAIDR